MSSAPREKVAIVAEIRTAVERFGGAFKETPAHELGAAADVEALLRRSGISSDRDGALRMAPQ